MVASQRASSVMEAISYVYTLKEDKKTKSCFGPPDMYLGNKYADDNQYCWSMSGNHYVKNTVAKVDEKLMNHGSQLNVKQQSSFTTVYITDMYTFPELDTKQLNYFQEMIGCLRWAIKLGRAAIATEVALISRHLDLPCRGHFDQCFNVYAYLKQHHYSKLVMNPAYMNSKDHYPDSFNDRAEWSELYGDVKEYIPKNVPREIGKGDEVTDWVDADHAGEKLTHRSHTRLLIFVSSTPIVWYSKLQAKI